MSFNFLIICQPLIAHFLFGCCRLHCSDTVGWASGRASGVWKLTDRVWCVDVAVCLTRGGADCLHMVQQYASMSVQSSPNFIVQYGYVIYGRGSAVLRYVVYFRFLVKKGRPYSITERMGSGADPGSWQSACR